MRSWVVLFLMLGLNTGLYARDLPDPGTSDQSNNIRHYLRRVAAEITDRSLSGIHSLEDWQNIRPQRVDEFMDMMGLVDVPLTGERPLLNVNIVDTIQQEGYRIVKLYYESLPDLYVPADLYIPDNVEDPMPAILYVCGHSPIQKVHYQSHPRRFAELGFVCLIIETIQWGEVRGDHWGCYSKGWFHWYSRGYNPGGVEVWNAIRGLDLLCERPEVNPEKLGVTGISGGGSQSWFIAAADPRIKAVAPVCGASTFEAQITARTIDGHCDCMVPINTYLIDFPDIGALIAPRPMLIGQADRDGLNTIESVREVFEKTKKLYDLYDAGEHIHLVETPGGHSYHPDSRQKIFSFFLKHLQDKTVPYEEIEDVDESEERQLSQDELRIYVQGPPRDDRTTTIQDSFIQLSDPPAIRGESDLIAFRKRVVDFLHEKTFRAFPSETAQTDTRLEYRTLDAAQYGRTVQSFVSEEGWRLKVDVRWKNPQDEKKPVMIVLRSPDENRWESEGFISGLSENWNVAYFETRGIGETGWAPELQWHVRRASAWTGRTIASMRTWDLLRCIEVLRNQKGVDPAKIGIAARGEMCVLALYAALLDGNCQALLLQNPPPTQNTPSRPDGRGDSIEMLNCLRITDVNQIPGLLYPMDITFVGEIPDSFLWSRDVYNRLGGAETFRTIQDCSEF